LYGRKVAVNESVNINNISSLLPNFLQPLSTSTGAGNGNSVSSAAQQTDNSTVSSFLSELQQLQTQSPSQFMQIDGQLVSNLQQEALQATANGASVAATKLNALATQFQNAANGGSMPTAQQVQQSGLGAHHRHGGGHHKGGNQDGVMNAFQPPATNSASQTLLNSVLGTSQSPLSS